MVVICLACPGVIGATDTVTNVETRSAFTWSGQRHGEHATGNGASGRAGLEFLPTFGDMPKVGPGEQGVETTPLRINECKLSSRQMQCYEHAPEQEQALP